MWNTERLDSVVQPHFVSRITSDPATDLLLPLPPPPPTPPLFPYPTLFRSGAPRYRGHGLEAACGPSRPRSPPSRSPAAVVPRRTDRASGDRKSTRLNSSHANISYAVFCLKKKKKK